MTDINTVVRFNDESKAIEVLLRAGEAEELIGSVESDVYSQWPLTEDNSEELETKITELNVEVETAKTNAEEWKTKYYSLLDQTQKQQTPPPEAPAVEPPPVQEVPD